METDASYVVRVALSIIGWLVVLVMGLWVLSMFGPKDDDGDDK